MKWHAHWEDPLMAYLTHFDDVIGDARTRTPFTATVKGIIAAGSLVCQCIAAQSPLLAAVKDGAPTHAPPRHRRKQQALAAPRCRPPQRQAA